MHRECGGRRSAAADGMLIGNNAIVVPALPESEILVDGAQSGSTHVATCRRLPQDAGLLLPARLRP